MLRRVYVDVYVTLCRINLWALWARAQGLAPQGASHLPCLALKAREKKN